MTIESLPDWVAVLAALALIIGGVATFTGSLGLLRLREFYMRMHGPSMGNTLGIGSVLIASMLVSSTLGSRPIVHELLITVFVITTAPMTAMLLMRAAVHRTAARKSQD
jgi:multicomponent K+:H+ antiporter subunit G